MIGSVTGPLAIVGASARAAAASAARAGFAPITADLFADADLRQFATATRIAPYPEGLLNWLRAVQPPAWMYTGALENHPQLVDQMAWIAPLWGNSGDVLDRVRSPWQLAGALRDAGLLFPETRTSADGLPQDGSWLEKTYRGASGSGVHSFPNLSGEGREAGSQVVYQRRVPGLPCSAVFVAADGAAALLGVTRQLVGKSWHAAIDFQYAGSIGPLELGGTALAAVARAGSVLAQQFELTGLFGIDFLLDDEAVWVLEVNPRYTASVEIVERASGIDAVAAHAAACRDSTLGDFQGAARGTRLHGKAILFARREAVTSERFATMTLADSQASPWPGLADISPAGTSIATGQPVLTVFAHGKTFDEVEAGLRERIAALEKTLYSE